MSFRIVKPDKLIAHNLFIRRYHFCYQKLTTPHSNISRIFLFSGVSFKQIEPFDIAQNSLLKNIIGKVITKNIPNKSY